MQPNRHFIYLRSRINARLEDPGTYAPYANEQTDKYPWLYGALGDPSADVMFICENPSLTGVEWAHSHPPQAPPDIEAQWWGGRFREVLCDLQLKSGEPDSPGGWACYITNVVKAMAKVADFNRIASVGKRNIVRQWADVLAWELSRVRPKVVFCVGRKSERAVKLQRRERLILYDGPLYYVTHYSARGSHEAVKGKMSEQIRAGLKAAGMA